MTAHKDVQGFAVVNIGTDDYIVIRKIIAEFAIALEEEMSIKDSHYSDKYKTQDINELIMKLDEERCEVDEARISHNKERIKEELIHEAIMTMILYKRISE